MIEAQEVAARVVDLVGDRAEAHVNVFVGRSGLTRFANSFIHQNVAEDQVAVHLRVVVDGRTATVVGNRIDALVDLVERGVEAARVRPVDSEWPGLAPPTEIPSVDHWDETTAAAGPRHRVELVKEFVAAGPDLKAAGYCSTEGQVFAFANTSGHSGACRRTLAILDGIHQADGVAGAAHQADSRLAELDGGRLGVSAAEKARRSRDPIDLEPGRYPVVLEPDCVATIIVFLAVYGFNARAVLEGRSFAQPGATQFDSAISIWDDALHPEAVGLAVDVEGTPKRRVDLVNRGVTVGLAHDRRTARRMGAESTGHAVPGGEAFGAMPTDLFVAAGDHSLEELIGGVERGLLVTEFNYCRVVEPKSLVVTGLTRNGTFLIERGEVVAPVSDLRFTQSFVDALAPGNVTGVESATRLADSEFGPGLVHAPAIGLSSWNFTGGAKG